MASLNDQFEYGRIPIKPLPYKDRNLSHCNELMINYGENKDYHIYITHHNDPNKYIDITALLVKEMLPGIKIDGNSLTVTVEGEREPKNLKDILNYIWKRFSHAEDPSGFVYETDIDKVFNPTTINVLLQTADGQAQLPITSTDNVYDKNGNSLQSFIDNTTRLGFSVSYIYATIDNQTSFEFEYPFEDYSDMLEVRIGTTYIDSSRYQITKHYIGDHYKSATLDFIDESIENGRRIDLVWIFNSAYKDDGKVQFMSGAKIADSTIPIHKLQKYSDAYSYSDSNSVATSKALANLYYDLTRAINANNQNMYMYADKTIGDNFITIIDEDMEPKDGDIFIVTTASAKLSTVKLQFKLSIRNIVTNMYTSIIKLYNIITPDGNAITRGFANNQVLKFKIEGKNAILISGSNGGNIRTNRYIYNCADQEYIIPFNNLSYNTGDLIHVYRNGVRLFQDLDYYMDTIKETISLFVRTEQGERIVFESLGI